MSQSQGVHLSSNIKPLEIANIQESRGKPILQLLMSLEVKFMVKLRHRYSKAGKWESIICPKVLQRLNKNIQESRQCQILHLGAVTTCNWLHTF